MFSLGGSSVQQGLGGQKSEQFWDLFLKSLKVPPRGSTFRDFCDFWIQKGLQKGELILRVAPLGAPLEPQSVFGVTFGAPSAPKSYSKVAKLTPKGGPKL